MTGPRPSPPANATCSSDGLYYKRTGDASVHGEADFQLRLGELGYPIPTT